MGCGASQDSAERQRSLEIDAQLKESQQSAPLRVLVLGGPRSGSEEMVARIARGGEVERTRDAVVDRALALACVARFGFHCPKDVACLLYRWALQTVPLAERGDASRTFLARRNTWTWPCS